MSATQSAFITIGLILALMAALAVVEAIVPLHGRNRWSGRHLGPNLALTFITIATNFIWNALTIAGLFWFEAAGWGLLNARPLAPIWEAAIVVAALDFAFYVCHVAMHKIPAFWRVHSVHHADPMVDVTTSLRQHPLEGLIRYAFIAAFALPLGASPAAFAIYRLWSALNALFEHADIRVPAWLDTVLSFVTTWPNMHKIHHARDRRLTDTNYGNIFSIWDRLFLTFTPSRHGAAVSYGLEGHDDAEQQTTAALLASPFTSREANIAREAMNRP
jgi:sterol desaturase/sphingolipid hydroxylase (fatty acid hydroxylase superfamily)